MLHTVSVNKNSINKNTINKNSIDTETLSDREREWDDWFISLSNFNELRDLAILIKSHNSTSDNIISYIKKHHISLNSYLPVFKNIDDKRCIQINGRYLPIIYHLSIYDKYALVVSLILPKIRVNTLPKAENGKYIDLLYGCHEMYIDILSKYGAKLTSGKEGLIKRLMTGQIDRVIRLYQNKSISTNDLLSIILDKWFMSDILTTLTGRLATICNSYQLPDSLEPTKSSNLESTIPDYRGLVLDLLHNYRKVIRFALKNGANANSMMRIESTDTNINPETIIKTNSIIEYSVKFYLVEIVEELLPYVDYIPNVVYHKELNNVLTATMRLIFNDMRYSKLEQIINTKNN